MKNYLKINAYNERKLSLLDLYSIAIYEDELEMQDYLLGETQIEVQYEGLYFDFYVFCNGYGDIEEIDGAIKLAIKLGFIKEEKVIEYKSNDNFSKRHKKFKNLINDSNERDFAEIKACRILKPEWYENNKEKYIKFVQELFKNFKPDFSSSGYIDWEDIIWDCGLKIYLSKSFKNYKKEFMKKILHIKIKQENE